MEFVLIDHAREHMLERGASEEEVRETPTLGERALAKAGRWAKERVCQYNDEWQGRHYEQKKIGVIHVEEDERLVVITVYAYYSRWEGP